MIIAIMKTCSNSSQHRLRLWIVSEMWYWSPQLAIPGVWKQRCGVPSADHQSPHPSIRHLFRTLGAKSAWPAKTRIINHCPKNKSTIQIRENLTLKSTRERSLFRAPFPDILLRSGSNKFKLGSQPSQSERSRRYPDEQMVPQNNYTPK